MARHNTTDERTDSNVEIAYKDPEFLKMAYWKRNQTMGEISEVFGVVSRQYTTGWNATRSHGETKPDPDQLSRDIDTSGAAARAAANELLFSSREAKTGNLPETQNGRTPTEHSRSGGWG